MKHIEQLFWRKSIIGYGCLVLLGTITTAGIVEIEVKNQIFSKWVKQTVQNIQGAMSNNDSSSAGQAISTEQVFYPFTFIGQQISTVVSTVSPFVTIAVGAVSTLFTTWDTLWGQIRSLFSTLANPQIYQEFFRDLHLKILRILAFAVAGGEGRTKFFGLFSGQQKESTMAGLKFLFGSNIENKKFRAKPEVLPYILTRWLMEPTKVTEKFEKLTKKIKDLTEKIDKNTGSSSSSNGDSQTQHVYELGIPTVREYIDIESGWKETTFNLVWATEIMAKINTGVDLPDGTKTWIATLGYFL